VKSHPPLAQLLVWSGDGQRNTHRAFRGAVRWPGTPVVVIAVGPLPTGVRRPVLFGQWIAAAGTPAALAAGGANRRPLLIKPASLLGLLVKFGLDGLDGPRRSDQQPEADQQDRAQHLDCHRALRCVPP
jgi:hypothetical protein